MNPVAIQAEDVMLVLTERLLAETEKAGFSVGDDVLKPISAGLPRSRATRQDPESCS
jgi:hypothetical protein